MRKPAENITAAKNSVAAPPLIKFSARAPKTPPNVTPMQTERKSSVSKYPLTRYKTALTKLTGKIIKIAVACAHKGVFLANADKKGTTIIPPPPPKKPFAAPVAKPPAANSADSFAFVMFAPPPLAFSCLVCVLIGKFNSIFTFF